ncbi:MAG: glycosyltransferase family 4 protein [Anaerolineales bacterium]
MRPNAVTASERRLRIVLPAGIFPPDIGGPASYVPRIAEALVARGHSLEVVALADDPNAGGVFPFPVRRIRRRMPRIPRMIETIQSICGLAGAADLIYANGLFIEAAIAAGLAGKPLVMKVVGDWAWERARNQAVESPTVEEFQARRQPLRWEMIKWLRTMVSGRADLIIAPSRYLAGIISAWGIPTSKIKTIYNAVEVFPDPPPVSLPPFRGRTLITVARLVPWKRIDALIEWLSVRSDLRLLVIGDGPERSNLESLATQSGAADRVVFTGNVSRQQVMAYLQASDLFVLNSDYEGLPHVVLEAYAAGVPVVATSVGGTDEVMENGNNGFVVPPRQMDRMAEAVDRLLSDDALRAVVADNARRTLHSRFRWETLVEQTEGTLMAVLAERKSRP